MALLAGCGGDEEQDPSAEAADFSFMPGDLTVKAGSEVTWTNTGSTTHTVKGPGFFSRAIEPGEKYRFTFADNGSFDYICTLHPKAMRGTVVVD